MIEDPLFESTHDALVYAFQYANQQSPRTPMTSLMRSVQTGTGKGLSGVDGAAQAGFILAEVCRLPDDQHNVIVARYGHVLHECRHCEQDTPSDDWRAAIAELANNIEVDWTHRRVRRDIVEMAIGKSIMNKEQFCKKYSISKSTAYRHISEIKTKFRKIERIAMMNLYNAFINNKLLVA